MAILWEDHGIEGDVTNEASVAMFANAMEIMYADVVYTRNNWELCPKFKNQPGHDLRQPPAIACLPDYSPFLASLLIESKDIPWITMILKFSKS